MIAKANTPFTLHEFDLVSFDQSGYPQPIPPGLAELPLYPDNHGFYSVTGPLDLPGLSAHTGYYPRAKEDGCRRDGSDVEVAPFSSETRHTAPHRPSNYWNPDTHGFYSVNGPLDVKGLRRSTVCVPLANGDCCPSNGQKVDIFPFSSEHRRIAPDPLAKFWNHDAISWFATLPPWEVTYHMSLTKIPAVSHGHAQTGGVTTAMSLAAPGEPRFRQSRH